MSPLPRCACAARPRPWSLAAVLVAALALALPAAAVPVASSDDDRPAVLERQIRVAFERADYAQAARLLERALREDPNDPVKLYNAACAYAQLGRRDLGAEYLYRSIKAGFRDFDFMKRDPDLEPIREHETYQAILEALDRVANEVVDGNVEKWKAEFGEKDYRYEVDEERQLAYATALDETAHVEMRRMLARQADHLIATLFEAPPSYRVLVAVPTPRDARRVFQRPEIGGLYEHHNRRLLARDIGGSLRHEFFHAYHYGHMERLGQAHPLWIQEGLASLYEDYTIRRDGSIEFHANDRRNIVKNLQDRERLMPWEDLFELSSGKFMLKAGQLYPQVRSIFEFVADRGVLEIWYDTYVRGFDEDRSGRRAFERTFGKALTFVERDWQRWLEEQPRIDHTVSIGDAQIGIQAVSQSANDGVLVDRVVPSSAAERARLRRGDLIVEVDGRPTRSMSELRRVIAGKSVGDRVRLRIRRDGQYRYVPLLLREKRW